jgi:5-methylcytosine-specific restriction endonuclease McrA
MSLVPDLPGWFGVAERFALLMAGMYTAFVLIPTLLLRGVELLLRGPMRRRQARESIRNIEKLLASGSLLQGERSELGALKERLQATPKSAIDITSYSNIKEVVAEREAKAARREMAARAKRELEAEVRRERNITRQRMYAADVRRKLVATAACPYCNGPLKGPHADHIKPLSLGGTSLESNMVFICGRCNARKGNQSLEVFARRAGLNYQVISDRLRGLGKLW